MLSKEINQGFEVVLIDGFEGVLGGVIAGREVVVGLAPLPGKFGPVDAGSCSSHRRGYG